MEFALLFAALVAAVLVGATASALNREDRRIRLAPSVARGDLDHYELAYLAGGPRRVVNTAIAALAARDWIRVSRGGRVTAVAGAPASSHYSVEQAVLDLVAVPGGRTSGEIRHEIGDGIALAGLKNRLVGQGFLLPDGSLEMPRRLVTRLSGHLVLCFVIEAAAIVIPAAGAVPWSAASILAPVIAAVAGLYGLITRSRHALALRDPLTRTGLGALRQARIRQPRVAGAVAADDAAFAAMTGAVALYGLDQFGDRSVAAEIAHEDMRRHGSHSSCASGSCGGAPIGGGHSDHGSSHGSSHHGDSGGHSGGHSSCGSSSCGSSSCGSSSCGSSGCGGGGCGGGCGGG
ncbi:TIGR04222 domain-containing membrane protein [Microbispora sp. RL4-1S]|uniref:TIGR04222 domain-containing membrane protein n=1 Tax=Microbispora oryzae TaxID=2806554 RepID=A0A940WKF1_9ACTN|nr:TIGR04222 domain-containing membrane protein [Microbispora oryzae]MBP2707146.1 TIGR04222 domain-containing membrane protein [Microbispora oryzae]